MLIRLSHPNLPYLFGICTSIRPLRIITQFHGIGLDTATLFQEIQENKNLTDLRAWILICAQLIYALCYLHTEVKIIHNDIKSNNIVVANSSSSAGSSSSSVDTSFTYHAVLIDFGKATEKESGRTSKLSDQEKITYLSRYPHIAPEVVHGEFKQSTYSDIYSIGQLLSKVSDRGHFSLLLANPKRKLLTLIENCRSVQFHSRPSSDHCLKVMKMVMKSM